MDQEYWVEFQRRMIPRITELFETVHVIEPGDDGSRSRRSDIVLGIAPTPRSPRPWNTGNTCWIPRMGERHWRSHPWSVAGRILLPLGCSGIPENVVVSHLGCGVDLSHQVQTNRVSIISRDSGIRHSADFDPLSGGVLIDHCDAPRKLAGSRLSIIWMDDPAESMPFFLAALANGSIPIVPERNKLLSFICTHGSLGLPCHDGAEAVQAVRYLMMHDRACRKLLYSARRYARRRLRWERVWRRLKAVLLDMMEPSPRVTVVVLNWNGRKLLPECFESLRDQEYPGMTPMLVDNGSTDGSLELMRNVFPEVRTISNPVNLGFAEGNNIGMRHAVASGSDYVVLLNNDTRAGKRWIRELVFEAERYPDIGIVGSRMLFYDNPRIINSAGGVMNQCFYGWDQGVFEHDGHPWNRPADRFSVTGGAMLIRSTALESGGYFDPAYFAYYEDNDLCHRLRLRGWRIRYAPRSIVFHKHSATSGPVSDWKTFLLERSRYRFMLKHIPSTYFLSYLPAILRQEFSEINSWARGRDYRRILLQVKAALSALFRLPNILAWRLFGSSGVDNRWTKLLERGFCRPSFPHIGGEFDDLYEGLIPRGRALPALMKSGLSGDWSDVVVSLPRYRILSSRGTVRLGNHPCDSALIQLHVFLPPGTECSELSVRLHDGYERSFPIPHPGWHTVGDICEDVAADLIVTLSSRHPVGINEISVIASDHPVARIVSV